MTSISVFALLILVASMVLGGVTSNVYAQDDSAILLKIAKRAHDQIQKQISDNSSDKIKRLFEEGTQKVNALEKSLRSDDMISAKEYFLSAMKIFTEISKQTTSPYTTSQTETDHMRPIVEDPSNDIQRLQAYVNSLQTIAKKYDVLIDFSQLDVLFAKARQQVSSDQFSLALETFHTIKENIVQINKVIREEASKQESQRAKEYAQKYVKQLDRLIENAKHQGVADEIIDKLEKSKENLTSTENPSDIVNEIRKIISIKDQLELTKNDRLESRILQIEKTLSELSQLDGIDQNDLDDIRGTLQDIKHYLYNGDFDTVDYLLRDLTKQLDEMKNSL